jgi:opacity protein-like surface antigen
MASLRTLIVASAGAVSFIAAAGAADMPGYPPVRTVAPAPVSGWYVRADFGYRSTSIKSAVSAAGFPELTDNQLDGSFWGGVGFGFKWGQLRTDITADYGSEADYTGRGGLNSATARIQTATGLANLYYDIGSWWRVTPYIGAGAGVAYTTVSQYQSATIPPLSNVGNLSTYNFAWALMAGANYQFTPRMSVDLGYRFLDQGDARTGSGAFGELTLKKLQSHELRIGLRWMYDAPGAYIR